MSQVENYLLLSLEYSRSARHPRSISPSPSVSPPPPPPSSSFLSSSVLGGRGDGIGVGFSDVLLVLGMFYELKRDFGLAEGEYYLII